MGVLPNLEVMLKRNAIELQNMSLLCFKHGPQVPWESNVTPRYTNVCALKLGTPCNTRVCSVLFLLPQAITKDLEEFVAKPRLSIKFTKSSKSTGDHLGLWSLRQPHLHKGGQR